MDQHDKRFLIFALGVVALLIVIALVNLYQARRVAGHSQAISYSQFLDELEQGKIRSVHITGRKIEGASAEQGTFNTFAPDDPDMIKALRAKKVSIFAAAAPAENSPLTAALSSLLPMLLLLAVAIFYLRRLPGGRAMGLGKSKAKLRSAPRLPVTFDDVAGADEAVQSLREIVDFLREPHKFRGLGGRIPRGVLLVGPPGTGKTLLARAVAGEASVPFYTISGSDFVEMFVGIGASRIRDMFDEAKKNSPCIIFMDEIDAVGRRRGAGLGGGNDEREQTLNQLLVEMDGFEPNQSVILIAATNRPDILDPALLRPGRFDREVVVGNPDILGREQILKVHTRAVPLAADVDFHRLARGTSGFSGADLMNLVNEAALLGARRGKDAIGPREFDDAKDTVMMGAERHTHVLNEAQRRVIAYRESGRALVALNVPAADPIHKVTIVTRGRSAGAFTQLADDDDPSMNVEQLKSRLAISMAGRAAEELVFGRDRITSATAGDIEEATKLARLMVTRWGLSAALGPVAYGENQDEVFLGHTVARQQNMSEQTAQLIALEVRTLLEAALEAARRILDARRDSLNAVAQALLEFETLDGDQIRLLLAGRRPELAAS